MFFWPTRRPIKQHFNCARHFLTLPNCFRCLLCCSSPSSLFVFHLAPWQIIKQIRIKIIKRQLTSCHAQKAIKN